MVRENFQKIKNNPLVANSAVFFVGSFLGSFGNYIFHFFMTRMLEVREYGELQSLIALLTILGIPAATLLTIVVKYTANFKAEGKMGKIYSLFKDSTKLCIITSLVFFVFFILFSHSIARFLNLSSVVPVIILGSLFLFTFLNTINQGILQGVQNFRATSLINIIAVIIKIILAYLFVKWSFGVSGTMGAIVLASLLSYFISFIPLKILLKNKEKEQNDNRQIIKYFMPVFFTVLFTTLFLNVDMILVKHFFPAEMAGQYGAITLIGRILFFVSSSIVAVMFSMTAAAHGQRGDHQKVFKQAFWLVVLIGVVVLFFYFVIPSLIIKILIGGKFLSIAPYLGWFGLAMFLYSLINILTRYLLSIHLTKYNFLLGIGILLQIIFIIVWHNNLWQIIWIMNAVMTLTLIFLIIFCLRCKMKDGLKLREFVNLIINTGIKSN